MLKIENHRLYYVSKNEYLAHQREYFRKLVPGATLLVNLIAKNPGVLNKAIKKSGPLAVTRFIFNDGITSPEGNYIGTLEIANRGYGVGLTFGGYDHVYVPRRLKTGIAVNPLENLAVKEQNPFVSLIAGPYSWYFLDPTLHITKTCGVIHDPFFQKAFALGLKEISKYEVIQYLDEIFPWL